MKPKNFFEVVVDELAILYDRRAKIEARITFLETAQQLLNQKGATKIGIDVDESVAYLLKRARSQ